MVCHDRASSIGRYITGWNSIFGIVLCGPKKSHSNEKVNVGTVESRICVGQCRHLAQNARIYPKYPKCQCMIIKKNDRIRKKLPIMGNHVLYYSFFSLSHTHTHTFLCTSLSEIVVFYHIVHCISLIYTQCGPRQERTHHSNAVD